MLTFQWPWIMLLLPLPLIYRLWRSKADTTAPALKSSLYSDLAAQSTNSTLSSHWHWLVLVLLTLAWVATLLASALLRHNR